MKNIIITIHGIGNQERGYSNEFQRLFKERYAALKGNTKDFIFEELFWADILKQKELHLLSKTKNSDGSNLHWEKIRSFMSNFVGDAIAYQKTNNSNDTFNKINERVKNKIDEICKKYSNEEYEIYFCSPLIRFSYN